MLAEVDFREHFKSNPVFGLVAATASGMGVKAYVVGGYVRDLFLNRTSKDIDFVCLGSGIALAEKVSEALGGAHISIFKNFGTAMIRSGEYELEFVGARKES